MYVFGCGKTFSHNELRDFETPVGDLCKGSSGRDIFEGVCSAFWKNIDSGCKSCEGVDFVTNFRLLLYKKLSYSVTSKFHLQSIPQTAQSHALESE